DEFLITGNTPTVNVNFSGNITYAGANSAIRITSTAGTYNGNVTFDTGALNVTGGTAINISAFAAGSTGTHNYYTTSGTATINAAGAPFVLDGTATAVTGVITYGGTINRTNGNGTLLNINTLSTPGSLTFSGTTLTGSTNAAPGWVVSIQNITGTVTTNHLNIADSSGSFGGTMVSIGGTNTGALNFHHMILS